MSFSGCSVVIGGLVAGAMYRNNSTNDSDKHLLFSTDYSADDILSMYAPDATIDDEDEMVISSKLRLCNKILREVDITVGYDNYYISNIFSVDFGGRTDYCISIIGKEYYDEYLEAPDDISYDMLSKYDYCVIFTLSSSLFDNGISSRWNNFVAARQYYIDFENMIPSISDGKYKGTVWYNGYLDGTGILTSDWRKAVLATKSCVNIYAPYGTSEDEVRNWFNVHSDIVEEYNIDNIRCFILDKSIDFDTYDVRTVNPYNDSVIHYCINF